MDGREGDDCSSIFEILHLCFDPFLPCRWSLAPADRHFSVTEMTLQIDEDSIPEQAAMTSANQTNFKDLTLMNGSAHKIKLKEEWIAVPT